MNRNKKLTENELKLRFFSQYNFQDVLRWHQWINDTPNSKIDFSIPEIEKEGWFLELKTISKITDEDAEKLQYTLINVIGIDGLIRQNSIELVKELVCNYEKVDALSTLPSSFTDKVRELGYAIDWNGYKVSDLIEKGWVKLI